MRTVLFATLPAAALFVSAPANAGQFETYNDPAPGYSSLMHSDFATAEREIRGSPVAANDPARAINLGIALAKTGRRGEAAQLFHSVLTEDDVEVIVADGQTVMSHDLAARALQSLQNGALSR